MERIIYLHKTGDNQSLLGYHPFEKDFDGNDSLFLIQKYGTINEHYQFKLNDSDYSKIYNCLIDNIHVESIDNYLGNGGYVVINFKSNLPEDQLQLILKSLDIDKIQKPVYMSVMPIYYGNNINAQGNWYINDFKCMFQRTKDGYYRFLINEASYAMFNGLLTKELMGTITISDGEKYLIQTKSTNKIKTIANKLKIFILWPSKQ